MLSFFLFSFWTQKSKIHFMRIHSGMRKQTPMKAKNENQNAKERLPSRLAISWYILTDTYPDIIPLFIWIAGKLQSDTNTFIQLQVSEIMTDTYPDTAILTHTRLFLKPFCTSPPYPPYAHEVRGGSCKAMIFSKFEDCSEIHSLHDLLKSTSDGEL